MGVCILGIGDCDSPEPTKTSMDITTNKKFLNQDELEVLNETVSKTFLKTCKTFQSEAKTDIKAKQTTKIRGLRVRSKGKGSKVKADMSNIMNMDIKIDVQQSSKIANNATKSVAKKVADEFNTKFDTKTLENITAKAKTERETEMGAGLFGGDSAAQTDVNIRTDIDVQNKIKRKLENRMVNDFKKVFNTTDVKKCINNMNATQAMELEDIYLEASDGGELDFNAQNMLELKFYNSCEQLVDAVEDTILNYQQELKQNAGMETVTQSDTTVDATAETSSKSKGLGGLVKDVGEGIGSIIGSIGGLASLASLGPMMPFILIIVLCIVSSLCSGSAKYLSNKSV